MLRPTPNPVPRPDPDCPLALCVEYISGAWTPQILWYLRAGPRRFGDLRRDLSVSAKVLTDHLRALEERLLVQRQVVETSPRTTEYSLTKLGQRFTPILDAIIEVGHEIKAAQRVRIYGIGGTTRSVHGRTERLIERQTHAEGHTGSPSTSPRTRVAASSR